MSKSYFNNQASEIVDYKINMEVFNNSQANALMVLSRRGDNILSILPNDALMCITQHMRTPQPINDYMKNIKTQGRRSGRVKHLGNIHKELKFKFKAIERAALGGIKKRITKAVPDVNRYPYLLRDFASVGVCGIEFPIGRTMVIMPGWRTAAQQRAAHARMCLRYFTQEEYREMHVVYYIGAAKCFFKNTRGGVWNV